MSQFPAIKNNVQPIVCDNDHLDIPSSLMHENKFCCMYQDLSWMSNHLDYDLEWSDSYQTDYDEDGYSIEEEVRRIEMFSSTQTNDDIVSTTTDSTQISGNRKSSVNFESPIVTAVKSNQNRIRFS